MADQTYTLIFEGKIAEGHSAAEVKKNLASLLKKDVKGIEPLFAGKPVVIKKDMTRPIAEKYRAAFIRAGALCRIEPPLGGKPDTSETAPQTPPSVKTKPTRPAEPPPKTPPEKSPPEPPPPQSAAAPQGPTHATPDEKAPIKPADPSELIYCPSCQYKQRQAEKCLKCGAVLDPEAVESVEADMIHCPACKYKQKRGEKCINCGVDIQGFKTTQMRRKLRQRKLSGDEMILTNIELIPGWEIVEHYGLVSGNTIRAKHIGKDILASLKNLFGGELTAYTQLLQESREEALERMKAQARELGANAIVNIRFSTSSVAQGAAELYAYGTAVRIE